MSIGCGGDGREHGIIIKLEKHKVDKLCCLLKRRNLKIREYFSLIDDIDGIVNFEKFQQIWLYFPDPLV